MTDDLGGDDRLVAFMQYLRVLGRGAAHAAADRVLFGGGSGGRRAVRGRRSVTAQDWLLTGGAIAVGGALVPALPPRRRCWGRC